MKLEDLSLGTETGAGLDFYIYHCAGTTIASVWRHSSGLTILCVPLVYDREVIGPQARDVLTIEERIYVQKCHGLPPMIDNSLARWAEYVDRVVCPCVTPEVLRFPYEPWPDCPLHAKVAISP